MLIDSTYFHGEIGIEGIIINIDTPSETNNAIIGNLKSYIIKYERKYLSMLLGNKLCCQFMEYLSTNHDESDTIDKWENLKNELIIEYDEKYKYSPIAYFVLFYFVRSNQYSITSLGVTQTNSDNPVVSANEVLVKAWNNMVDMTMGVYEYLKSHKDDYQGWQFDCSLLEKINVFGI